MPGIGKGLGFGNGGSGPRARTLIDQQFYTKGKYYAYLSPWSIFYDPTLQRPEDYEDTLSFFDSNFPGGVVLNWRWPTGPLPAGAGVWGYLAIGAGNYDYSIVQSQIVPKRVNQLVSFTDTFGWSTAGSLHYDVLHELYLTSTPHQATALDDKKFEVAFIYYGDQATINWINSSGTLLGTWVDGFGKSWRVTGRQGGFAGYYIIFFPVDEQPVFTGATDWTVALTWLTGLGLSLTRSGDASPTPLSADLYVNGVAFGIEPAFGGGSGRLSYDYQTTLS